MGEKQYLDLINNILNEGTREKTRNGYTLSLFGEKMKFSLENNTIPFLTSKKLAWKTCLKELLWFISGSTDNSILNNEKVHIWDDNTDEYSYFKKIGWNLKNVESQFNKVTNYSLGYFKANNLVGLLIGDAIKNDKYYDLELHILFVSKDQRRKQIATKLLNYVETNIIKFSQIFIEVAEDNLDAIRFYKKNNFVFLNFRHNYYKYNDRNIHAKCFIKKMNHES